VDSVRGAASTDRAGLQGKVAIVTGSSSGIGEAIARRLAAAGAGVVVNSARSVAQGRAVAAGLPDAVYVQGDITDGPALDALVAAAGQRWGRLDLLVNNAGTTVKIPHADLDSADIAVWRQIFEVNVFGAWELIRRAMPLLKASGDASVLNISSLAGTAPSGSSIPYASSKAALDHMTRLLARVSGPEVRVNALSPGLIRTPWTEEWGPEHAGVSAVAPLRRSGTPDDVAEMAYALLTSAYTTGQVVLVDGGLNLVL
jgi:ketoreductase RED2